MSQTNTAVLKREASKKCQINETTTKPKSVAWLIVGHYYTIDTYRAHYDHALILKKEKGKVTVSYAGAARSDRSSSFRGGYKLPAVKMLTDDIDISLILNAREVL